jgi:GLPGLI family protein
MKNIVRLCVVALAVSMLAAVAFSQGVVWESKIVANGHEMTSTTSYLPKKLKNVGSTSKEYTIMRLDQEKLYNVNTEEKTYSVITFAELEEVSKKMNAKMDEAQEKMKSLPEEQRKMMEKMMGGALGGKKDSKIDVKKTGEKKTISGFPCSRYSVTQDGKEVISLWVTPEVKAFAAMKQDMADQSKRMAALAPGGLKGLSEAMTKIDGFPIQTEMGSMVTTTVTKVETKAVNPSEFEVPAGFKQVSNKLQESLK